MESRGRAKRRGELIPAVTDFYRRVQESPRLRRHFDGIAMGPLIEHQAVFLRAAVLDHPYSGRRIEDAHRGLGITDDDFDEMIEILDGALDTHGVEEGMRSRVIDIYRSYRPSVVEA